MLTKRIATAVLIACGFAVLTGCDKAPPKTATPTTKVTNDAHNHEGWWCNEHGVPEDVCALCNAKIAAEFKAKGDWCQEHDRPESQCFACNPEKQTEFAAQYEAKYGKQPPKPNDVEGHEPGHDHDHKS